MAYKYRIVEKMYSDKSVVFIPEYKEGFFHSWKRPYYLFIWTPRGGFCKFIDFIKKYEDAVEVINEWKKDHCPKPKKIEAAVVSKNIYTIE